MILNIGGTEVRIEFAPISGKGPRGRNKAETALLKQMLGEDVELSHLPNGAPCLPSHPEIYISISHTSDTLAIALCRECPVGVDIERADRTRQLERVATRFLTPGEKSAYYPERLAQAWTLKEALFKALGTGDPDLRHYTIPTLLPHFSAQFDNLWLAIVLKK